MIDSKDILKMAKHVFKRGQGFYDKRSMHPTREWLIGLFVLVVLIIVGGIQSAYTFLQYQNITTDGGSFNESIAQFNSALSEKAIATYLKRKEAFTKLQGEVPIQRPVEIKVATSSVATTTPEVETSVATSSTSGGAPLVN
jgi:hypothetical protein